MIKVNKKVIAKLEAEKSLSSFISLKDFIEKDFGDLLKILPSETKKRITSLIENKKELDLLGTIIIDGKSYQIDKQAQSVIGAFLSLGKKVGSITWRTFDNENIDLSVEEFSNIAKEIFQASQNIYKRTWEAKDEVLLASTEKEIKSSLTKLLSV